MSRLDDALALVRIPSESRHEAELSAYVESRLRAGAHLEVERVGDNVIARTNGLHATRVLVAGHLDTVPGDAAAARLEAERLHGLGAVDMKASLAVMLELATDSTSRSVEVTWVFYAREEIARRESGLVEVAELRPDLLVADVAVLGEPTAGAVEAGCQGSMRVAVRLRGGRAHTARPHQGRNAIHRLAGLLERVAGYEPRAVEIDGVTYVEQLQAVFVEGGVASNVVPDAATVILNHRVAPDRDRDAASHWLMRFLDDVVEDTDEIEVQDWAPPAAPSLGDARLSHLVELTGRPVRAKVGWTDVATFSERGIPATNFGAGDPLLAHTSDEVVSADELDEYARVLGEWLR
ncbi:MAG TPA: succinyl-diaminopimelate desuccinylase [Acidimicrobiales bacterium]|nr:succinyl-diaminopimelate desuccinylase [Acidimicrobiales bacterium]